MAEPASLLDIPEAPVPPGAEAEWISGAGGAKLRAALFRVLSDQPCDVARYDALGLV